MQEGDGMRSVLAVLAAGASLAVSGCGGIARTPAAAHTDTTCTGRTLTGTTYLTVWFHASASIGSERATMIKQVAAFNHSQSHVRVRLITLPEGDYETQVRSAAAHGDLPDVLDLDGPYMYNYAWSGKLKPIDSCLTAAQRAELLPSIRAQGTYDGRMWGVGTFDSGLGLYVRKSVLAKAGIRIPTTPADAWTAGESPGSWPVCARRDTASPWTCSSCTAPRRASGIPTDLHPRSGRPAVT
jgi:multiple sugar transport system substrate-binding protein